MTELSPDQIEQRVGELSLDALPIPEGSAVYRLFVPLRELHRACNGDALLSCFRLRPHPILDRLIEATVLAKVAFADRFVALPDVRRALPQLELAQEVIRAPAFRHWEPREAAKQLVTDISVIGAPYEAYPASEQEVRARVDAFWREAFGENEDVGDVFTSGVAWAPWFRDAPWDATWLLVNRRSREVWLLCITDTD